MGRCDSGCGRHALTLWEKDPEDQGWAFCGPCTTRHADALDESGYELWMDDREVEPAQV